MVENPGGQSGHHTLCLCLSSAGARPLAQDGMCGLTCLDACHPPWMWQCSLIHSFSNCLLNDYNMSGTGLGSGGPVGIDTNKAPGLLKLTFCISKHKWMNNSIMQIVLQALERRSRMMWQVPSCGRYCKHDGQGRPLYRGDIGNETWKNEVELATQRDGKSLAQWDKTARIRL